MHGGRHEPDYQLVHDALTSDDAELTANKQRGQGCHCQGTRGDRQPIAGYPMAKRGEGQAMKRQNRMRGWGLDRGPCGPGSPPESPGTPDSLGTRPTGRGHPQSLAVPDRGRSGPCWIGSHVTDRMTEAAADARDAAFREASESGAWKALLAD
jgi:hypothetical protein